jgi:hypothetical protein
MNIAHTSTKIISRRSHTIKLRVNSDELAHLQSMAAGTPLATFIREQILKDAVVTSKRQYRKPPTRSERNVECSLLAREIAKIGNNLNQLARVANSNFKNNLPIENVILSSRLYAIWEELHVLQSV